MHNKMSIKYLNYHCTSISNYIIENLIGQSLLDFITLFFDRFCNYQSFQKPNFYMDKFFPQKSQTKYQRFTIIHWSPIFSIKLSLSWSCAMARWSLISLKRTLGQYCCFQANTGGETISALGCGVVAMVRGDLVLMVIWY